MNQQALARRYRPQTFDDVLGQDPVVTTLKNALLGNSLAHAYLFAGTRGTGKTTLARLLAKAINCTDRKESPNPCNICRSCTEITQGCSMNVLEIDGASHRGIEDIRQLNETVGYVAVGGGCKVYIIDEVHMLTKEAFNALLKTLEEPPPKVKFIFATTEPHKVLPTILSRCQRFELNRLDDSLITQKLQKEAADMGASINEAALHLVCRKAEGSMRDAESLLDQLIAFHGESIDASVAADALGLVPFDLYFRLDQAAATGDLLAAFTLTDEIMSQGKSVLHVLEGLAEHYRNRLLLHLNQIPKVAKQDLDQYRNTQATFTKEQCLQLLDELLGAHDTLREAASVRLALEALFLKIVRTPTRLPLSDLVTRLLELEGRIGTTDLHPKPAPIPIPIPPSPPRPAPQAAPAPQPPQPKPQAASKPTPPPVEKKSRDETLKEQNRYNTVMRFAAVEFGGSLKT